MATGNGRYLQLPDDRARRHEQIAKFSRHDAGAIDRWDGWLGGLHDRRARRVRHR